MLLRLQVFRFLRATAAPCVSLKHLSKLSITYSKRECDVMTACPIESPKNSQAFASVHRTPTKLGSVRPWKCEVHDKNAFFRAKIELY